MVELRKRRVVMINIKKELILRSALRIAGDLSSVALKTMVVVYTSVLVLEHLNILVRY